MPTADVYYATAGFWGDSSEAAGGKAGGAVAERQLTARVTLRSDGSVVTAAKPGDYNTTGCWAQITKSTDGGATWDVVFSDFENNRYPNDISCFDANTCVAALEGEAVEPQIVSTTDGALLWWLTNP